MTLGRHNKSVSFIFLSDFCLYYFSDSFIYTINSWTFLVAQWIRICLPIQETQELSEFTFLPGLLRPDQEGTLHLHQGGGILNPHPTERVPAASVNRASSVQGALLAFCVNQGRSSLFLFPFLTILSPMPSSWGYPWILLGLDPGIPWQMTMFYNSILLITS